MDGGTLKRIKERAGFDIQAINRYELETHHDVIAFLKSVEDSIGGDDARAIHYGLTSSDVVDTALSMMMRDTVTVLIHMMTRGEPQYDGYGLWMKGQLRSLNERVNFGQLSGPVGTHATFNHTLEHDTLRILGLNSSPISTQVLPRDVHADYAATLARLMTTLSRIHGSEAVIRDEATLARARALAQMESIALWHERDISHSSVERLSLGEISRSMVKCLGVAEVAKMGWELDRMSRLGPPPAPSLYAY